MNRAGRFATLMCVTSMIGGLAYISAFLTATAGELPSHEYLAKACGKRFDDRNGRDLDELKRRLNNRQKSLVDADPKEVSELQCRISKVSASQR
jgi:hypothetical protein